MKNRACFLDRDGVLIHEENYLADPAKARLIPGAAEAVKLAHEQGYKVIVVSNQSGIARGYFTMAQLKAVEARIDELLAAEGAALDANYYCCHHPKGSVPELAVDCDCRKPKPGMLLQAERDFDVDPAHSFMIGDKTDDLNAGFAAGCAAAALVRTGHGSEQDFCPYQGKNNAFDCPDVLTAVRTMIAYSKQEAKGGVK